MVVLLAARLARPDVPAEVAEVTFGMGVAAGLLIAADLLRRLVRDRVGQAAVVAGVGILAVLAATAAANAVLFGSATAAPTVPALWGAAAMLAAGAAVAVWRRRTVPR
ncbi:hypothetical protein MF406_12105 [Georgenia sp. TF02-10]|uniref:hypothetical protein n=1 Tax=Georgenia sp. TF02-10 TaxID=2917725 RepID=UPI001FA6EC80|nr:hypothetical protein [Georgenia sp. TF02-10]UNX53726.1 hypothetical protein MF406_12105 [Georgenia sp. TF02-10]